MQQLFGVYMGVQSRPDSPVNVENSTCCSKGCGERLESWGRGAESVKSFATFVVKGATFDVLLKPKVNVTRTTLMLGDRIFHPYANCISCILKQCTL